MSKKLYDISMIFVIGVSPLCFEYIKQNVDSTSMISKIQSDLDQLSQQQQNIFFRQKFNLKEMIDSTQQPKINPKMDMRIQTLKLWKSSSFQKYINEVSIIAGLHSLGGLLLPSAFYLSILSYFILYQANLVNDIFILNGRIPLFEKSNFSFEKINQLYMFLGAAGLGIAGVNKGISTLTRRISNDQFK